MTIKVYSVNLLYLIFNKLNGFFDKNNGSKYFTLVATNESKEEMKKYGDLWIKIRYLVRRIPKELDDYSETYMKIKFNSYHDNSC